MKGLGSPWNDKCSETDSGSHNNQRNRIDNYLDADSKDYGR